MSYYVYVAPGHDKIFENVSSARDYAEYYESKVLDLRDNEILFDFSPEEED